MVNPLNIAVVLMVSLRGMELQCECVCVCLITWAVVLDAVGVSHNKLILPYALAVVFYPFILLSTI